MITTAPADTPARPTRLPSLISAKVRIQTLSQRTEPAPGEAELMRRHVESRRPATSLRHGPPERAGLSELAYREWHGRMSCSMLQSRTYSVTFGIRV